MYSRFEQISATRAAQLLASQNPNRSLSANAVDAIAWDMFHRVWLPTPQGLIVRLTSQNGSTVETLEDGQHRCAGLVRAARMPGAAADFTVEMNVTYLERDDPSIVDVLDTGRTRSFADQLKMKGEPHYVQLSAVTRRLWDWDNGQPWNRTRAPSRHQLWAILDANPQLREGAQYAHRWSHVKHEGRHVLSPALAGFGWVLFRDRIMVKARGGLIRSTEDTTEDRDWFLQHLSTGADLEEGSPLLALRHRQLQGVGTTYDSRGRSSDAPLAALIVTWNHFRARNAVQKIQLPRVLGNKSFPVPW